MSKLYKIVNGFDSISGAAFGGGGGGGGGGGASRARAAAAKARAAAATASASKQFFESRVTNSKRDDGNNSSKAEILCASSTAVQAGSLVAMLHPLSPPPVRLAGAVTLGLSTLTQSAACGYAIGNSGGQYSPPNGIGPIKR